MKMSTISTGQESTGLSTLEDAATGQQRWATNTQRQVADSQKKGTTSKDCENSRRIYLFSLCCIFILSAPLWWVKNI